MVRMLSTLFVIFFTLILLTAAFALDSNVKIGKYRVGVNYSPLSACAVWPTPDGYLFRAANSTEYLKLSTSVFGLSVDDSVATLEKVAVTRPLTDQEKTLCNEIKALDATTLKVSKASSRANPPNTRPTYDITATTKTGNRVLEGTLCEGLPIKGKYHKIIDRNETAICEEY